MFFTKSCLKYYESAVDFFIGFVSQYLIVHWWPLPADDGDTGSDGSRDEESDNDESVTPPNIDQDNNEDDRPRPDR